MLVVILKNLHNKNLQVLLEYFSIHDIGAAKVISDATAALKAAIPNKKDTTINFNMDVTAAILDACISIASAAQSLVTAAAKYKHLIQSFNNFRSQTERVDKQRENPSVYKKDPMWANGLISAAKNVAGMCIK